MKENRVMLVEVSEEKSDRDVEGGGHGVPHTLRHTSAVEQGTRGAKRTREMYGGNV